VFTKFWSHDREWPVARAMARRLNRSPRSRRIKSFWSSDTGPFCGSTTNRWPQARQRNVGVPAEFGPFRTTWVAAHRRQGGTGVVEVIPSGYHHAAQWATTGIFRIKLGGKAITQIVYSPSPLPSK
jgi:hypothetical protein